MCKIQLMYDFDHDWNYKIEEVTIEELGRRLSKKFDRGDFKIVVEEVDTNLEICIENTKYHRKSLITDYRKAEVIKMDIDYVEQQVKEDLNSSELFYLFAGLEGLIKEG